MRKKNEDIFELLEDYNLFISFDHICGYGIKDNEFLDSVSKCYEYLEPISIRRAKKLRLGYRIFTLRNIYLYCYFKLLKKRMKGKIKVSFPKHTAPLKFESKTMLGFIAPYSRLYNKTFAKYFKCLAGCKCQSIIDQKRKGN